MVLAHNGRQIVSLKLRGKDIETFADFPEPLFKDASKWIWDSKAKHITHIRLVLI